MSSILDSINLTELAQKSANSEEFMKSVSDAMYAKLSNEQKSADDLMQQMIEKKISEQKQTLPEKPKRTRGVSVK